MVFFEEYTLDEGKFWWIDEWVLSVVIMQDARPRFKASLRNKWFLYETFNFNLSYGKYTKFWQQKKSLHMTWNFSSNAKPNKIISVFFFGAIISCLSVGRLPIINSQFYIHHFFISLFIKIAAFLMNTRKSSPLPNPNDTIARYQIYYRLHYQNLHRHLLTKIYIQ